MEDPYKSYDLFGFKIIRPEVMVKFLPPPPVPFWKKIWYGIQDVWENAILPALLLGGAIFCFELSMYFMFR